jgi:hypothetical protein
MHLFPSPYVLHAPPISVTPYVFTLITFGEEWKSRISSLCNFLSSVAPVFLPVPNISRRTRTSKTFSLSSILKVTDQVLHPYETTGKTIFLCISISIFLTPHCRMSLIYLLFGED